jgi:hypothetical protein
MPHTHSPLLLVTFLALTPPATAQKADPPGRFEAKPVMLDPGDLLIGPADADLDAEDRNFSTGERIAVKRKVRVRLLTKAAVVYQEYKEVNGKPVLGAAVLVESGDDKAVRVVKGVRTANPKGAWKWDPKAGKEGEFAGPVVPPEAPSVRREEVSGKALEPYLVNAAEGVHLQVVNAVRFQNAKALGVWSDHAKRLRDLAQQSGAGETVRKLFDLADSVKEQKAALDGIAAAEKKLQEIKLEGEQAKRAIGEVAGLRKLAAFGRGGYGLLLSGSDDQRETREGVGELLGGVGDFAAAAGWQAEQEYKIQALTKVYGDKAVADLEDKRKAYRAEVQKLADRRAAAWKAVNIDPSLIGGLDDLAAQAARAKDVSAAVDLLDRRNTYLRERKLIDSFSYTAYLTLKADLLLQPPANEDKRRENAQAVADLAREAVAAAARVPADPAFAPDRARVLAAAADLIHRAVAYEVAPNGKGDGPKCWSAAFDPRADYGVRLCDLALDEVGEAGDWDGRIRATRAWLLFQRGLHAAAFGQGQKVEKVTEWNPYAQCHLARLYASQKQTDKAVERIERAVAVGFHDLEAVDRDADFARVIAPAKGKRLVWEHYKKPNLNVTVSATPVNGKRGVFNYSYQVTNNGSVPLVDAQLSAGPTANKPLGTLDIPYLPPKGSVVWYQAFDANPTTTSPILRVNNDRKGYHVLPGGSVQQGAVNPFATPYWWR